MMAQSLPATVEELNSQQSLKTPSPLLAKKIDFEDIPVEKRLKREVSLPTGVENWNISNFDSYLNFDEALENAAINSFDVLASPEDRLVPQTDLLRDRSSSISSMSSVLDDKQVTFHNFGVKTINTISMDSGSTCISSDHTYVGKNPPRHRSLDPEETYQNLDQFLQQVPDLSPVEVIAPSSFSPLRPPSAFSPLQPPSYQSSSNDSFELTVLETLTSLNESTLPNDSVIEDYSFPSTSAGPSKRPLETINEEDVFIFKHTKLEANDNVNATKYHEIRRKNNIASKNCRKTRKEKQRDMEIQVVQLEQERERLKVKVQVLEQLAAAYKQCLINAISQKR